MTSVVPIRVKSSSNGRAKTMRPVAVLKRISVISARDAGHDDVATFDEPHGWRWRGLGHDASLAIAPTHGPVAFDHCACTDPMRAGRRDPQAVLVSKLSNGDSRFYSCVRVAGGYRVRNDKPRVVDPAIPIGEAAIQVSSERRSRRIAPQIDGMRAAKRLARGKMIVKEKAGAHWSAGTAFR